jgi:hypothetical protein
MAGTIKLDDTTQKVISADLGIDYAGHIKNGQAELARVRALDGRVKRTLTSLGMSDARPLAASDHKTLGAHKDAKALIADFEKAGSEIATAHFAYGNLLADIDGQERKAINELFAQAAKKVAARMKEIEKKIAVLNEALAKLEAMKKGYVKQIDTATDAAAQKFRKDLHAITDEIKTLGARYAKNVWDFEPTRKYIKK